MTRLALLRPDVKAHITRSDDVRPGHAAKFSGSSGEGNMRRRVTRASSVLVFLTLAACPSVSTGAEAVVRFDRQCAQKDIAVMVLIETHADIGELAPSELAGAWETLLDARTVCSEGRVSEALALYQTVLDLGPPRAFLRQVNAHRDDADRSRR